jgi:NADH-quinone oxidoreductase subunit C
MTDEPNNPAPEDPGDAPQPEGDAAHAPDAGTLPPPPDADQPRPTPESQAALTGKAPSGSSTAGTTVPAASSETQARDDSQLPTPKPPSAPPANETPEEKKARLERVIAEAKAKKEASAASAPAQPPTGEMPEEKKARLERVIAEAKAKKEAAAAAAQAEGGAEGGQESASRPAPEPPGGKSPAVGDPTQSPSQADLEKAAKIAEAKARAAALKEAAASKSPATPGAEKPSPAPAGAAAAAGAPKAPVKKKDEGPKPSDASDHPLAARVRERFGEALTGAFLFLGQLSLHVRAESIVEVCRHLRDDAETPFDYLSDLTCVHYPDRTDAPFEVVYNLYSIPKNERVRLKAAAGEAGIDSVTSVWPSANWMEREVYDMFGVAFNNHPDLRRLLLPKDWDGHPLRKDYPLEFMENEWTTRHLPEFTEVQREQLAQRRAYGLEILQTPDERRIREIFRDGRDPLPKEHK